MDALLDTVARTRQRLLQHYDPKGAFCGELSSSALSTATAAMAFALASPGSAPRQARAEAGWSWLCAHQREDGGWGDTPDSPSNVSTTTLCWASLGLAPRHEGPIGEAIARAETWLTEACGGALEPARLAATIRGRYGADQTFSVPILTMCALAGRLGKGGWRWVPQLPFELAALPHRLFRVLRLRVVSYALPALIAIGQVRHRCRPTKNPITRFARYLSRERTLRVLAAIQPGTGGYLEAAPLTSFVAMSLIGMGLVEHPVVVRGLAFLDATVRPDGSWPIDTNLDTWCTTLAVGALPPLDPERRSAVSEWLFAQQGAVPHPYTHADPGGFAWTDLAGGVPDADDTAGAVLALRRLSREEEVSRFRDAASRGIVWLLDLQNRDGGMPTFCRGWGRLPFDRSGPDLTAHALRAFAAWREVLPSALGSRIEAGIRRGVAYLLRSQRGDGAWLPLWFGNQQEVGEGNPIYGTSRVVRAVAAVALLGDADRDWVTAGERGVGYLLAAQQTGAGPDQGGFGVRPSIEETALAVEALAEWCSVGRSEARRQAVRSAVEQGVAWLVAATASGTRFPAAPIGLYFARLWYSEILYPLVFTASALAAAQACPADDS